MPEMPNEHVEKDAESLRSRREFVKKVAYTAPIIVTLVVNPSHAQAASGRGGNNFLNNNTNTNNNNNGNNNNKGNKKKN